MDRRKETNDNTYCQQCDVSWYMPADLPDRARQEVVALATQFKVIQAIGRLRDYGIPLADAKQVMRHLTQTPGNDLVGLCHNCGYPLADEVNTVCTNCNAVCYNW